MNILRNILAVIIGFAVGMVVNMGIINISGSIIPPPEGFDLTTMEGLNDAMAIMTPKHFIMPFLAHALGTLVGAFVAVFIAASHKLWFALGIGVFFLMGGVYMVVLLPSTPMWFSITDIGLAYIPMGWLGYWISTKFTRNEVNS